MRGGRGGLLTFLDQRVQGAPATALKMANAMIPLEILNYMPLFSLLYKICLDLAGQIQAQYCSHAGGDLARTELGQELDGAGRCRY